MVVVFYLFLASDITESEGTNIWKLKTELCTSVVTKLIEKRFCCTILQLISNDRFKSVEHQVLANLEGPRVSIACFFTLHLYPSTRLYGPINELLSENHPPVYRETSLRDFIAYYDGKGLDGNSALTHFKCQR